MSNKNKSNGKGTDSKKNAPNASKSSTSAKANDSKSKAKKSTSKPKSKSPDPALCVAFNRAILGQSLTAPQIKDSAIREFGKVKVIDGANVKEIAFEIGDVRLPEEGFYMGV